MRPVYEIKRKGLEAHIVRTYLSIRECGSETGIKRAELVKSKGKGVKTEQGTILTFNRPRETSVKK